MTVDARGRNVNKVTQMNRDQQQKNNCVFPLIKGLVNRLDQWKDHAIVKPETVNICTAAENKEMNRAEHWADQAQSIVDLRQGIGQIRNEQVDLRLTTQTFGKLNSIFNEI